jgi:hypothetical protein
MVRKGIVVLTYGRLRSRLLLLPQPALLQAQQVLQAARSVSPFGDKHPRDAAVQCMGNDVMYGRMYVDIAVALQGYCCSIFLTVWYGVLALIIS